MNARVSLSIRTAEEQINNVESDRLVAVVDLFVPV